MSTCFCVLHLKSFLTMELGLSVQWIHLTDSTINDLLLYRCISNKTQHIRLGFLEGFFLGSIFIADRSHHFNQLQIELVDNRS